MCRAALACGGLAIVSDEALATDGTGLMGSKPIHQEEDFGVSPDRVYSALLDAKQFGELTGQRAEIEPTPGGSFKLFNDRIVGRTIELVPNQRVVQAWREPSWTEGMYSIVRFNLKARGSGTQLIFDHWGFPEEGRPHLTIGWPEHYWEPMRRYFAAKTAL